MDPACYAARVGGLAVTLGPGAAVAAGHVVASAKPSSPQSTSLRPAVPPTSSSAPTAGGFTSPTTSLGRCRSSTPTGCTIGYRTVIKTIPLDRPNGVAVGRDGSKIYVSHEFSGQQMGNTMSVIDGATNAVVATIAVGALPSDVAVSPDSSRVYVTNSGDHTVSVIAR